MRMLAGRYASPKPAQLKKVVAKIQHLSAPLKGMSLSSQLTEGKPLTAPILENWNVEEDKITVRAGTKLLFQLPGSPSISALVPYYGTVQAMLAAAGGKLFALDASYTVLGSGFARDDWHWTSFSNLGELEYTLMVNGHDGVWSWNGGTKVDGTPVVVTKLDKTNPAQVTVAAADISKFVNGAYVKIVGADASHAAANGTHLITAVGTPVNTFSLVGVDLSAAAAAQTTGLDATPLGSLVKESVTAPPSEPWINPQQFDKVLSHMNRVWFADSLNLAVYYLPVQAKSGVLKVLPLNAVFRRGGHIVAMYTWTLDGGEGLDDQIVIFSSNGEAVIYNGVDPDSDWTLTGIFRFDSPMSKYSVVQYGGDLYVLTATGLFPMSSLLKATSDQAAKADKNVVSAFWDRARVYRNEYGWGTLLDHHSGMMICNIPEGGNRFIQMVRFMPDPIWAQWSNLPARCWQWIDGRRYFGTVEGKIYELSRNYLSDDGQPIIADVQFAWSSYKTPVIKHFNLVLVYIITDGVPRPYIDMKVDYDMTPPQNLPEVSRADIGAYWDLATWDEDYWAQAVQRRAQWQGVGRLGRVAAPRIRVSVLDCTFSIAGAEVIFEPGAALG